MKNLFEIKPLEGLGDIKFGMSPKEVDEKMNEGQVWENWMGGNRNDSLMYRGIIFMFDDCNSSAPLENSKLTDIDIYNREDIFLFGKLLNEWTQTDFLNYCEQNKISTDDKYDFIDGTWSLSINLHLLNFEICFDVKDNSVWVGFFMNYTKG
jgi:hypothetical protein